ncbi:uncharacterized protein LOC119462731 [Dermacentor silvarum]|uniref:uncharacterized protein LOC119462731 n=1 Tax=Dermacentor silvarum TaxID=543639 RepID=UPI001896DC82|nr:uncharacterized protein LOC119462731 [Dermacentor silvarum]
MTDVSLASLPCFSLDEKILQILWDEGVQMEELLEFSFERVGKLAAERGVELDDANKEELWLYVQRMKAEQPDWVSLSHYQDRSSRQLFDSCLEDFTGVEHFHTAQLSWDTSSWNQSCHASFSQDSLDDHSVALYRDKRCGQGQERQDEVLQADVQDAQDVQAFQM